MTERELEELIRECLRRRAGSLPLHEIEGRMNSDRPHWRNTVMLAVAAVLICATLAGAYGSAHRSAPPMATPQYPLPSTTLTSPSGSRQSQLNGIFHAAVIDGQACAWVGPVQKPTSWPPGWAIELHPTRLIDPRGRLVAHAGDMISASSTALHEKKPSTRCNGSARGAVALTSIHALHVNARD